MEPNKLFTYGILKRGYEFDMSLLHGTKFIADARLMGANLYRVGLRGVGLRFVLDQSRASWGDLWEVKDEKLWRWLDDIEANGFAYTRKVVSVEAFYSKLHTETFDAWVYEHSFPGMRYKQEMLIENGIF